LDSYYQDRIVSLFDDLSNRVSGKNTLTATDLESIFNSIIDSADLPVPSPELYDYFISPEIIKLLLFQIHNDDRVAIDTRKKAREGFEQTMSVIKTSSGDSFTQVRVLGSQGLYPNIDIERDDCVYTNYHLLPTLITTNSLSSEAEYSSYSEVSWMTRNELRFATAVICAAESGLFYFYFNQYDTFSLDHSFVNKIPTELRKPFLYDLIRINDRFTSERMAEFDMAHFDFGNFKSHLPYFESLFDHFDLKNQLLMRTAFYLVKSIMLWNNRVFAEEAIANVFFCLEGCLHLIQKKHDFLEPKLNLRKLKQIFSDKLTRGENLFEFIEEAYEKRIAIVHPEPVWGSEWNPSLMAEDFYDYFKISRELLNYVLIDRILEIP
jgi:hypothetical protein